MKKPAALRAHLQAWIPDLAANPDKLHVFINAGRTSSRIGKTLSFEIRYQLEVIITDFGQPTDTVTIPLLIWLQEHQPDLFQNLDTKDDLIKFEAEIVDHDRVDIAFKIDLSERVIVQPDGNNGYTCTHVDEPTLDDLTGITPWSLYLKGEEV